MSTQYTSDRNPDVDTAVDGPGGLCILAACALLDGAQASRVRPHALRALRVRAQTARPPTQVVGAPGRAGVEHSRRHGAAITPRRRGRPARLGRMAVILIVDAHSRRVAQLGR